MPKQEGFYFISIYLTKPFIYVMGLTRVILKTEAEAQENKFKEQIIKL